MASFDKKKILGASLGNCVHVAGILSFLKIAEQNGYDTHFLGPAISLEKLAKAIRHYNPDIIALSYRLTPEVLEKLLALFRTEIENNAWQDKIYVFGGTPRAAEKARESGIFEAVFSGIEPLESVISFLKGKIAKKKKEKIPPQNLMDRIRFKSPYPLLRHHFGLPTLLDTIKGSKEIALSESLDIISLGPDQNAQESFFRPNEMRKDLDGAGGVPLRKPEDLETIHKATRCGNCPLLRCYSGTRDLILWAEMCLRTINTAWGAVPLFWYNKLDGRSERTPEESIRENQQTMKWYGEHNIPLEVNESHHWSLREAPDTVAVAAAFLAAYNAKKMGVNVYVAQYMFNTPAKTSPSMDLAKMLAKIDLIESLQDKNFKTIRQTRTGLASLSSDPYIAKGQLATSCFYQLALEPKIIHVVGFCEGDHAATPSDIIESSKIVYGVLRNHFLGPLSILDDPAIRERKEELVEESRFLLSVIQNSATGKIEDPLSDPGNLAQAVQVGLLDASHLCGNPYAAGKVFTKIKDGACVAVDPATGKILSERQRIARIKK